MTTLTVMVTLLIAMFVGITVLTQLDGIVPESAASWFLPRAVGMQTALEWVMTGRHMTIRADGNSEIKTRTTACAIQ